MTVGYSFAKMTYFGERSNVRTSKIIIVYLLFGLKHFERSIKKSDQPSQAKRSQLHPGGAVHWQRIPKRHLTRQAWNCVHLIVQPMLMLPMFKKRGCLESRGIAKALFMESEIGWKMEFLLLDDACLCSALFHNPIFNSKYFWLWPCNETSKSSPTYHHQLGWRWFRHSLARQPLVRLIVKE